MMRKTLIALAAVAALGVSSSAMARQGGPGGGHGPMGGTISGGHGPVGHGPTFSGRVGGPSTFTPRTNVATFGPHKTFTGHHVRHNRFGRNAFFFGVGFAGAYGYDSCWRLVPTYWGGWQRVWVCDYPYPYWGY